MFPQILHVPFSRKKLAKTTSGYLRLHCWQRISWRMWPSVRTQNPGVDGSGTMSKGRFCMTYNYGIWPFGTQWDWSILPAIGKFLWYICIPYIECQGFWGGSNVMQWFYETHLKTNVTCWKFPMFRRKYTSSFMVDFALSCSFSGGYGNLRDFSYCNVCILRVGVVLKKTIP